MQMAICLSVLCISHSQLAEFQTVAKNTICQSHFKWMISAFTTKHLYSLLKLWAENLFHCQLSMHGEAESFSGFYVCLF